MEAASSAAGEEVQSQTRVPWEVAEVGFRPAVRYVMRHGLETGEEAGRARDLGVLAEHSFDH